MTIIALARKIMTLDFEETPGLTLIGIAIVVAALALAYYIVRQKRSPSLSNSSSPVSHHDQGPFADN